MSIYAHPVVSSDLVTLLDAYVLLDDREAWAPH